MTTENNTRWECPVCYENVNYPMTLGGCGHSVCVNCTNKLDRKCPTCKKEFTGTLPNYTLGSYFNLDYQHPMEERVINIPNSEMSNEEILQKLDKYKLHIDLSCLGFSFVAFFIILFLSDLLSIFLWSLCYLIMTCVILKKSSQIEELVRGYVNAEIKEYLRRNLLFFSLIILALFSTCLFYFISHLPSNSGNENAQQEQEQESGTGEKENPLPKIIFFISFVMVFILETGMYFNSRSMILKIKNVINNI